VGGAAALAAGSTPYVVGREAERARVDAFTAALARDARALVIRGESGIGKTALWRHTVELCRRAGFEVLRTRPAEEEMRLALVGLTDLFEHVEVGTDALQDDDQVTRGQAVLEALRRLAARGPTVVAIDDAQWLDTASARALRYALRRLDAEPVGVLQATRAPSPDDPLAAASTLPPGRCDVVELGPLSQAALRRVLAGVVPAISRPMLRRIHAVSGGNPLYAIELARGVAGEAEAHRAPGGLPLPDSLQAAIELRLETVPATLLPLLETVSALGHTSVRVLSDILAEAELAEQLATAAGHGLLVVEEDLDVRFAHPLVGSAVYARMTPLARRSLHARLADRAGDEDVRARHLALSTDDPDAEVAALLESAAERASRSGASDLAAEFAGHSLRLTPAEDADGARRRALAEIEHLASAGEVSRALGLADELLARLEPGPGRAEALVQLAQLEDDDLERGEALLLQALEDAREDELLCGRVLDRLGWLRGMFLGNLAGGIECLQRAVAIADERRDPGLQLLATAGLAFMETLSGVPRPERMAAAIELEAEVGRPLLWAGPRALLGKQRFWDGELAEARELFEAALAETVRDRNERLRSYRLYDLALADCAAGDLASAEEIVGQGLEFARDAADTHGEGWLLYPAALVFAWRGNAAEARAAAGRRLEWAERRGERPGKARARSVLGLLALSEGDAAAAAAELSEAARLLEEIGIGHPGAIPVLPDAIEALAGAGDLAVAEELLERLERQTAAIESGWARAAVWRGRGVLLLARGEADAAASALERAAADLDGLGYGADAARAMLAQGRALLRAGRRSAAAEVLADACDRFAAMGAELWEAQAKEELERAQPTLAVGDLTRAERRVAALIAEGMKNREIAQTLYMSVATVEGHLTRIYRKLDLRSRNDLARLVADGSIPVAAGDEPE
jgi:DNA-binding CsgD family transcriptional regulator